MNKLIKKFLSISIIIVITICSSPLEGFMGIELLNISALFEIKAVATDTTYTEGYYTYTVDENDCATITDVDTAISGDITIPSTLGSYPVISIGNEAFYNCGSLTSVSIPDSVISIGDSAFFLCMNLTKISIGNNVISIGEWAFRMTGLTSVAIPKNVMSIGEQAFQGTIFLTNITVDIANKNYSNDEYGVLFNKNKTKLILYPAANDRTSYVIPQSVTSIETCAFWGCRGIESVTIPDNVTSIGNDAFYNCVSLTSISIPNSVMKIDGYAFCGCTGLTSITIPNRITAIYENTFGGCTGLTSIIIPDSVIAIDNSAFYQCTGVVNIILPDSITFIGYSAFYDCDSLQYVHIPSGVTYIGDGIFSNTNTYICSDTEDCYAKEYAEANGYTFVLCDGHKTEEHTHSYTSTITKEASCKETGIMTYSCECGESYTEEIAKAAHTEGEWETVTEATCTTQGEKVKKCIVCGETLKTENIPVTEHISSEWEVVTEATCTTQGKMIKKCTVCGEIIKNETIPFADHPDKNSDGLCDICDKISDEDLVKDIYISISSPEKRTIKYMESIKLYATTANLPDVYKIKWKVEGDGVEIKPSALGTTCTVTSTSTGNVVIKAYVVDSNGKVVTDENGKQISDSEYFYSEANLWLRIVYFFKKLFGISMTTAQLFKDIIR